MKDIYTEDNKYGEGYIYGGEIYIQRDIHTGGDIYAKEDHIYGRDIYIKGYIYEGTYT